MGVVRVAFDVPQETRDLVARLSPASVKTAMGNSMFRLRPLYLRNLIVKSQRKAKRTGFFANAWTVNVTSGQSANRDAIVLRNNAPYAVPLERGSKPHIIKAKPGKTLAWRKGGRGPVSAFKSGSASSSKNMIFSKKVRHPGARGKFIGLIVAKRLRPFTFIVITEELNAAFTGQGIRPLGGPPLD